MGMDLIGSGLSYNWARWQYLLELLEKWGVNIDEFEYFNNDGHPISKITCMAVADAIEAHLDELDLDTRNWLEPQIPSWRYCNGCSQY